MSEQAQLESNAEHVEQKEKSEGGDDIDILAPCWFYLDSNGLKQGPFSFKEMYLWYKGGFFRGDLLVKQVWDSQFQPLSQQQEFYNTPPSLIAKIEKEQEKALISGHTEVPLVNNFYEEPIHKTGQTPDLGVLPATKLHLRDSYFASKGLHGDRDMRMMSHYFDYNQYSKEQEKNKEDGPKKKIVKGSKKFWKERKEKKRRLKLVKAILED